MKAMKHDQDKPRWDLLPFDAVEDVVKVLTYGAKKYDDDNWHKVVAEGGGTKRYFAAMLRHIKDYKCGEINDPEWGLHNLAHAACCALFIVWRDKNAKR